MATTHTFDTHADPALFLEVDDGAGTPVRLAAGSTVLVRAAADGAPLPSTTALALGYLSFTTQDVPGVQVSGDGGTTWRGPFWSKESRASLIDGNIAGSALLDQDTGKVKEVLIPPRDGNFAPLVNDVVPTANIPDLSTRYASTATVSKVTAATDPIAHLDSVSVLAMVSLREVGETLWPQGIGVNEADDELYVANNDAQGSLRIDVWALSTQVRKSSRSLSFEALTYSESLPWWKDPGSGDLMFIVETQAYSTANARYAVFNYTKGTVGANVPILGSSRRHVDGDVMVTVDSSGTYISRAYLYDWASIQQGAPSLLATIPLENPGNSAGKIQGVALQGNYLYLTQGEQNKPVGLTVYDLSGRLVSVRRYSRGDFMDALNAVSPGLLTTGSYTLEPEGAAIAGGRLVTSYAVNNNPDVVTDGVFVLLQRGQLTGAVTKQTPVTDYVYDTDWVDLTLLNGWTFPGAPSQKPQARRVGGEVRVRGTVRNATLAASTWSTFAKLPASMDANPLTQEQFPCAAGTSDNLMCRVDTDGSLSIWCSGTNSAYPNLSGIRYWRDLRAVQKL